jgi:DNA-binding SARP family transcriptional activator
MRDFRLLGPIEVRLDGEALPLQGGRQRAILAVLCLAANRLVPSEDVVEALWGEEPPRTAGASLRNALVELRRLLGPDAIETRPPGYVLHAQPGEVDLLRFERTLEQARAAPSPEERAALLREALAEWRGAPLPELAGSTFAQGEIRRLEELRITAVEDRIDADLEAGAAAELVPELEALVSSEPHRERLRGQLMLALYRSGRQAEALQAFQDARRVLAEELGIDPGVALRRLHGAILRQEAALFRTDGDGEEPGAEHFSEVADVLLAGRVVPVLGTTVDELATALAARFRYPSGDPIEIARVSQFAAATMGTGPLHDELRALVGEARPPTEVHRFLAALPPLLRERGAPHQLIVTTGYDDALERAFADAGEELDVVSYLASGPHRGTFCHRAPDGSVRVIDVPNAYAAELALERRTIVLRVRGRLDADAAREFESFVVTEDDHIDFLRQAEVATRIPIGLAAHLRRSHFLFLGYTLRDWCLRLVLGRVWDEASAAYRSWAVHPRPGPSERELWRRLDVELVQAGLEPYVEALARAAGVPLGVAS